MSQNNLKLFFRGLLVVIHNQYYLFLCPLELFYISMKYHEKMT